MQKRHETEVNKLSQSNLFFFTVCLTRVEEKFMDTHYNVRLMGTHTVHVMGTHTDTHQQKL